MAGFDTTQSKNWFRLEDGRVTNVMPFPSNGATTYVIHLAVEDNERHIPHLGKVNPNYGRDTNLEIIAEGIDGDDPWASLSVNDVCTILGEIRWQGGAGEYAGRELEVNGKKVRDMVRVGGGSPILWGLDVEPADPSDD